MTTPVFTFAAYSNTGKTTYIESLIPFLKANGLRVAVVKHDAHDFEMDHQGKDTWRFAHAGADAVAIASDRQCACLEYRPIPLDQLIARLSPVDIILTEGFKHGSYPKIGLFRQDSGKALALPPDDCFAIVSDTPPEAACPVFPLNDPRPLADHLTEIIRQEVH